MTGHFATARAGHDAGILYVIVGEEGGYVYLSDGRLRTIQHPKKKNCKHIQMIRETVDADILTRLQKKEKVFDHEIKYAIKQYLAGKMRNSETACSQKVQNSYSQLRNVLSK